MFGAMYRTQIPMPDGKFYGAKGTYSPLDEVLEKTREVATIATTSDSIVITFELDHGQDLYDLAVMVQDLASELNAMGAWQGMVLIERPQPVQGISMTTAWS